MKIAYLTAGAAGMYCGSCLHDNTLAAALIDQGEDVTLAPIYTPIRTDEQDVSDPRVFYGGINVYLQQASPLFRRLPRWADRVLDHPALLRLTTRGAGSVDPAKLGPLTVSMLRGEEGRQRKELARLCDWLATELRPDVVHLSNAMMIGMARQITASTGAPVVCNLSGEDIFLEKLVEPHYSEARGLLRARARDAAALVALNKYYADYMADYLTVERGRIEVIPHGLNLAGHAGGADLLTKQPGEPRRIGYLARVCHEKGLHLLVEAAEILAQQESLPAFEVLAAGYLGAGDREYLARVERRARSGALGERFRYLGELDRGEKIGFLQSLDVFSLPTVYRESKGIPVLEALANGAPAVLPAHGAFPELVGQTGGGVLFEPENVPQLAEKLADIMRSPAAATEMGRRGHAAVHGSFHVEGMADATLGLYRRLRPVA